MIMVEIMSDKPEMRIEDENIRREERKMKKDKKLIIIVIIVLCAISACTFWWYLSSRSETKEAALTVVSGGSEKEVDVDGLSLTHFSGTVVNGKGEKKDIEAEGVKLSDVIDAADYSEVTVTADDSYSASVKKEELENAWLEVNKGEVTLYVFGDENSKRNVRNVVRIEAK